MKKVWIRIGDKNPDPSGSGTLISPACEKVGGAGSVHWVAGEGAGQPEHHAPALLPAGPCARHSPAAADGSRRVGPRREASPGADAPGSTEHQDNFLHTELIHLLPRQNN